MMASQRKEVNMIKDKKVLALVKRVNSTELNGFVLDFQESERKGRTDEQVVKDLMGEILDWYEEDGSVLNDDLAEARAVYKHYKGYDLTGRYHEQVYFNKSKDIINEYNRLKRNFKKLQEAK
jgi:hypothetical protein